MSLVAALLAVALIGALSTHRTSPLVTPGQAATVLHDYWPAHEDALVARNLPDLARFNTGSARQWEQGAVACGCYHVLTPRPLLTATYFVPRQTQYPIHFITEAQTVYEGS